jgi:thiamine-phosphate pyrophosphorylase
MLRYAITDGTADSPGGVTRLLGRAKRWAGEGIDFVQLREKQLDGGAMLELAEAMAATLRGSATKLLLNSRPDIAIAAGADGVHLTARPGELTPAQVRQVFAVACPAPPLVSVACHTLAEVAHAAGAHTDLILFGPVFEKRVNVVSVLDGVGLEALEHACTLAGGIPVLALGGVTLQNSRQCLQAGASGVAGIRLFA